MKKQIKDENFAEIMQKMIKIHHKSPELRFMQLIINAIGVNDPYYMEDEQLLEQLKDCYEK